MVVVEGEDQRASPLTFIFSLLLLTSSVEVLLPSSIGAPTSPGSPQCPQGSFFQDLFHRVLQFLEVG